MINQGLHYRQTAGLDMFVEEPEASTRDAIRIVLCGQMIRAGDLEPNPDVEPNVTSDDFCTIGLETLVRMKLNSFRRKDQVHILDMMSVGLVDQSWLDRFPPEIRQRPKQLLDDPEG